MRPLCASPASTRSPASRITTGSSTVIGGRAAESPVAYSTCWSSRFVPNGPVIIGLDDTLERRWGAKIQARGIYRDPVRSSHGHFVKASGLRWLSVMLLPEVSWAGRVWGLPFLTALAPSERYSKARGRPHKKLTDWGRQVLLQASRWLPGRKIIAVAGSSYAAIDRLNAVRRRVCMITRLRLDGRLFDPPARRRPDSAGRPRVIGKRQANLAQRLTNPKTRWRRLQVTGWYGRGERLVEVVTGTALWHHPGRLVPIRYVLVRDVEAEFRPQAFLCTDLDADPLDILGRQSGATHNGRDHYRIANDFLQISLACRHLSRCRFPSSS